MRGFLKRLRPQGLLLWVPLCALLLLGIVSTLIDLGQVPNTESRRANSNGQRVVVDPISGAVSLGDSSAAESTFDVGGVTEPAAPVAEPTTLGAPSTETPAAQPGLQDLPLLRTEPLKQAMPTTITSKESLVSAPAAEVTEKVDGMALPKAGQNDATASKIYALRFTRKPEQELLSIIITDAGMGAQADSLILNLPRQVTVAFSPYGRDTAASLAAMRRAGYETWGMLPTMGEHFPQDDPGPLGLVASLPKDELQRRLRAVMAETIGSVGLVLPPDETMNSKPEIFGELLKEAITRGLYVLSTHPMQTLADLTKDEKLQASMLRADILLDPVPDEGQIQSKLAGIPAALKKKGSLIVVSSSRPQSLVLIQKWLATKPLGETGVLAPLSAQWIPVEAPPAPKAESGGHGAPAPAPAKTPEKKASGGSKPAAAAAGHH